MKKLDLFEKEYDGESLYDLSRDVMEAFDYRFNPVAKNIPQDQYGIQEGKFVVKIEWVEE